MSRDLGGGIKGAKTLLGYQFRGDLAWWTKIGLF